MENGWILVGKTRGFPCGITFANKTHRQESSARDYFRGRDKGIPVSEMKAFHEQLKKSANTSRLYIGKNGKHGFCNGRSGKNPFFFWSLNLTDAFLVEEGILTGRSIVRIPNGVARLQLSEYDVID